MLHSGPSKYFVSGKNQEKSKCAALEEECYADEVEKIQSLETKYCNMTTESLNYRFTTLAH